MKNLLRPDVWVRLVGAVVVALVAAGWIADWFVDQGYRLPGEDRFVDYSDADLDAKGYQVYGVVHWSSTTLVVTNYARLYRHGGLDNAPQQPTPAWAFAAAETGCLEMHRHTIGWPIRFLRVEQTFDDPLVYHHPLATEGISWFGPIPFATRPLFPGFLLLVAAAYGLLLTAEIVMRIPCRIRSGRWRRRGCCVGCGYDLAGIAAAVCPECGVVT